MARGRRWRRGSPEPAGPGADDDVDLDAPEHAWWAHGDIHLTREQPEPEPEPKPEQVEAPRDVLAEHFGTDWRTSFGFDHPGPVRPPRDRGREREPEPIHEPDPPVDTSDPYAVLGVEPSASWDEIVDAHRALARRHHPDRLAGRPADEVAAAEQRIRDINVAYQELRVRRDK